MTRLKTEPGSHRDPARSEQHLGFGCAGLYGIPAKRDRLQLLEHAYELGIRHFDVAPIYGLGLAESELANFIRSRSDVRVATKFGMRPTAVGRLAGLVQAPIRRLLQLSPAARSKVRKSGAGPDKGFFDRVLYSGRDYSAATAHLALTSSLRELGTDHIDCFMLHEPVGAETRSFESLANSLEAERQRGVIGSWGPAGNLVGMDTALSPLLERATAVQYPYDLIGGYAGPPVPETARTITYGFLSATLPRVRAVLAVDPSLRQQCSALLDADLSDPAIVLRLLVRDAVLHNQGGIVLVSTTRPEHLEMVCRAAEVALPHESQVAAMIRARCRNGRDAT